MKLERAVDSASAENPEYRAGRPRRWVIRYSVEMRDTGHQRCSSSSDLPPRWKEDFQRKHEDGQLTLLSVVLWLYMLNPGDCRI